jgi:O-antigen/teichoic acid export membrane protein
MGRGLTFAWKNWFGNVIPLTLGFGAFQFMFGADPLFVQSWFSKEETPDYMAAAILSQALVNFTGPVVWVMFPKIVRSMATREETDVFWLGLLATLGLLSLGALCLSLVAPVVIQIVYGERYLDALPLLRWYPWALVPLGVANVLLNNLMARGQFGVVKWLLAVAGLYAWLLIENHGSFITVIQILGLSNFTFLVVLLWYTWRGRSTSVGS